MAEKTAIGIEYDVAYLKGLLTLLKPALETGDAYIPILSCFMFEGGTIKTFNDVVAIQADLEPAMDWIGAVNGPTLLGFLTSSNGEKVSLVPLDNDVLEFSIGRSKIKLPSFDEKQFLFQMPEMKEEPLSLTLNEELINALDFCLQTCTLKDGVNAEMMGVTLDAEQKRINIYSTNRVVISKATIKTKENMAVTYTCLPKKFLDVILPLAKRAGEEVPAMDVYANFVVAAFPDCLVVSKLIEILSTERIPYDLTIGNYASGKKFGGSKIPEGFAEALTRSQLITGSEEGQYCKVSFGKGKAKFKASSPSGEFDETISCDKEHEGDLDLDPIHTFKALSGCTSMSIVPNCILLFGENRLRVVASVSE